jgi:hypothetical protein
MAGKDGKILLETSKRVVEVLYHGSSEESLSVRGEELAAGREQISSILCLSSQSGNTREWRFHSYSVRDAIGREVHWRARTTRWQTLAWGPHELDPSTALHCKIMYRCDWDEDHGL